MVVATNRMSRRANTALGRNVSQRTADSQPASVRHRPARTSSHALPRAARLLSRKIEFIYNPSFAAAELDAQSAVKDELSVTRWVPSNELLDKDTERELFRRMNWLKYQAARLRDQLDARRSDSILMDRIEELLESAAAVQDRIVTANLRLVPFVAKSFLTPLSTIDDLISDGNLALLRAVEKFDYDLGNRFSTYATYAIRRSLYRAVLKGRQLRQRFTSSERELHNLAASESAPQLSDIQLQGMERTFAALLDELDDRERQVIAARFGLNGDEPKTFRTLGLEMGVCKERVRQIQARALSKLKSMSGPELARLADI